MSDDIVMRLRDPSLGSPRWMDTMAEAAAEITRLRAELATARLEGMEEAAQIADRRAADWAKSAKGKFLETKWDYESRADAGEEIAAAIRAAAEEGKP